MHSSASQDLCLNMDVRLSLMFWAAVPFSKTTIDARDQLIWNQWLPLWSTISITLMVGENFPGQHGGCLIKYPNLRNDLTDKEAKGKVLQGFPKN